MRIESVISKKRIDWTWNKKLNHTKSNTCFASYNVNISKTPKHLANYMIGLLLSEVIAWNSEDVVFDELTAQELKSLKLVAQYFVQTVWAKTVCY